MDFNKTMWVRTFREAVQCGEGEREEEALRSLIGHVPIEVSFEAARGQLVAFLPTFEERAPGAVWARPFLEGASAVFTGGEAPVQPVDFSEEEGRHSFAGASNYISGLEELWLALRDRSNRPEFERWIFQALYNGLAAEFEHLWGQTHGKEWAEEFRISAKAAASGSPGRPVGEDLKRLVEIYRVKREDPRLRKRRLQLCLKWAARIEQTVR